MVVWYGVLAQVVIVGGEHDYFVVVLAKVIKLVLQ